MILTCPNCATRYLVDPASLGAMGREVRCAKCSHQWYQDAPPPAAVTAEATVLPPISAHRDEAGARPSKNLPALRQSRPKRQGLGWLALAVIVVALLVAAVLARGPIMAALPQVTPLYVMLHLAEAPPEALPDVIIRNQQGSSKVEGGQTLVVLTAEVYNPAGKAQPLRPIRIAMRDADKKVITEWTVTLGPPEIGPGASLPLVTQQAVQPGMRDLEVNFLPK